MGTLGRRLVALALLAALWWGSQRWWRARTVLGPAPTPTPATPWPPVPSDPTGGAVPLRPDAGGPTAGRPAADGERAAGITATLPASGAQPPEGGVDPVDGACPDGFPVKALLRSKLYHLPGMAAYNRTSPDRCYRDAAAAEEDGFRRAKR